MDVVRNKVKDVSVSGVLLPLLLLVVCTDHVMAKRIPIGVVLDEAATDAVSSFRSEVERSNNKSVNIKLDLDTRVLDTTNTFLLTRAVCDVMSRGVFALVVISNRSVAQGVLHAHLAAFNMPLLTTHPSPLPPSHHVSPLVLHLWPRVDEAVSDVIAHYSWHHFYFVYDTDDALMQYEHIMQRLAERDRNVTSLAVRLTSVDDSYDVLRLTDSETDSRAFVLALVSQQALHSLLTQIQRLGMIRQSYHYIITTLTADQLDLSAYKYGGVNFTAFNFIRDSMTSSARSSPRKEVIGGLNKATGLDAVLAREAALVLSKGLEELHGREPDVYRNTFRRGLFYYNNSTVKPSCISGTRSLWRYGSTVYNFLKQVSIESQSPATSLTFDQLGFRKNYTLAVLEQHLNTDLMQMGKWNSERGLELRRIVKVTSPPPPPPNNTLRVTTIISQPFLTYAGLTDTGVEPQGNERYEGYCADLAERLAELCKFTYVLQLVSDGKYGESDANGTWNGMVGELTRGVADLVIAPLTITAHRERVIDFSKPFMSLGISIMIKKPEKQKPGIFSFMQPLSVIVWLLIILALLVSTLVLFLISRMSPYEWQIEESRARLAYTNDFSISNSMWFAMAALMRQGNDMSPRSTSGRILGSVWWFFTLIVISSYTANLAAFLTIERMYTPINSADELVKQNEIQYGTLDAGSTKSFFAKSEHNVYSEMWKFMSTAKPSVFVHSTEDGVARVQNSKGKYAFLLESTMNDFYNQRQPCNTMKIGRDLDSKGYGIGTPLGSPWRDKINLAILKLTEDGVLQQLQKKWWIDKGECTPEDSKGSTSALTLSNVAGIFYILISCLGLSMIVALLEYSYTTRAERHRHKKTFAAMLTSKNYSSYSLPSSGCVFTSNLQTPTPCHTDV